MQAPHEDAHKPVELEGARTSEQPSFLGYADYSTTQDKLGLAGDGYGGPRNSLGTKAIKTCSHRLDKGSNTNAVRSIRPFGLLARSSNAWRGLEPFVLEGGLQTAYASNKPRHKKNDLDSDRWARVREVAETCCRQIVKPIVKGEN
jgi:hypothetical protein